MRERLNLCFAEGTQRGHIRSTFVNEFTTGIISVSSVPAYLLKSGNIALQRINEFGNEYERCYKSVPQEPFPQAIEQELFLRKAYRPCVVMRDNRLVGILLSNLEGTERDMSNSFH